MSRTSQKASVAEPELYTFEHNDIKWIAVDRYSRLFENRVLRQIEQLPSLEKCMLIKRNVYRVTYKYKPHHPSSAGVYIKRYRVRDWRDKFLTRFRQSQAHREWKMMLTMRQKGFPVPEPIALGERWHRRTAENYLVTLELARAVPIREAVDADPEKLLIALADLANKLRKECIYYKDFQLGNILFKKRGLQHCLYLVDLHSARLLTTLTRGQVMFMLAKLLDSFPPMFSKKEQEKFLRFYAQGDAKFNNELESNIKTTLSMATKIRETHLKSRTKRCLVKSTGFSVGRHEGWKLFYRKELTREAVLNALEAYRESTGKNSGPLKRTKKSSLTIVDTPEGKVCVKHYRSQNVFDRIKGGLGASRARRAWITGNGLVVRNVPTSAPLALIEGMGEAFVLSKPLIDLPRMDHYILEHFKGQTAGPSLKKKEDFIRSFARAVRSLHDKRVYHGDLKACNILIKELPQGEWEFYFIDYDKVVFNQEVSPRRRIKNLAQLHTSIPWCITWADRMRFYKAYAKNSDKIRSKTDFLSEVMKESGKRIPVFMEPIE
ncbi:MAG: lipopolysaccharide kinase InaA family protein [Planctomycetota bacterium]|jgi:tRNA A-37 threonylcarbamoyl transferase component Bud32